MMQALLGAITPKLEADQNAKGDQPAIVFCRDPGASKPEWAVYRADAATNAYVLALGDGGTAIETGPSLAALVNKGLPSTALKLAGLTSVKTYPDLSTLPSPEQAIDITQHVPAIASTATLDGDTNISINPNIVKAKP